MDGPEVMIPLAAVMLIFGIPIIIILTNHQRKMAELIHGKQGQSAAQDLSPIYHELKNLRDSVNSLSMNVDSLRHEVKAQGELADRLNAGE
jgi:MFS-type transporter involved in bile tolerance (Atg22 family)